MINIDGYLKHIVRAVGHSNAMLKGRRNSCRDNLFALFPELTEVDLV
jgi:hypothetical protein